AGARTGLHPLESPVGTAAAVWTAWRLRIGEGVAEMLCGGRRVRRNRQLDFPRCAGARAHGAARGGVAWRRTDVLGVRLVVRFACVGRRRGCAAANVPI